MAEMLSQLLTPEVKMVLFALIAMVAILYILSIVWVVRDAYLRGTKWFIWAIVALIPLLGVIAYSLLRPALLQSDREEQELEIALKQRQLQQYGECATCGYPVESSYVLCPSCHTQLKNLCTRCDRALDPSWSLCPYCATPVGASNEPRRARRTAPRQIAETAGAEGAPQRIRERAPRVEE